MDCFMDSAELGSITYEAFRDGNESKLVSCTLCGSVQCETREEGIPSTGKLAKGSGVWSYNNELAALLYLSHEGSYIQMQLTLYNLFNRLYTISY